VRERVDTSYYWLKRLHSLTGVVPLTAFVIIYFALNSFALASPAAFDKLIVSLHGFPLVAIIEIVFIALPLLLHVMMGLVIIFRSSTNVVSYSYYRNWMYFLQRVSGIVAFIYIAFHVWSMRIAPALSSGHLTYAQVQAHLAPLWAKVFYVIGITAILFHLANGLVLALMNWGIAVTRRSQFAATIASWILMIALWVWGMRILFEFAR